MKPPSPFLQQYVFATDPPVVAELMEELTRLEATQGDANGVLVPRDLDHADETLRGLMERVWKKEGGKKSIPLQRVHRRVKEVVVEFLNDRNSDRPQARDRVHVARPWCGRVARGRVPGERPDRRADEGRFLPRARLHRRLRREDA